MSLFFLLASIASPPHHKLGLSPGKASSWRGASLITTPGKQWFAEGNISTTVEGNVYSTKDGSLKGPNTSSDSGSDPLGSFTRTTHDWTAGTTAFQTSARTYTNSGIIVYSQTWPQGAEGTAVAGQGNTVSSCYPSINPTPVEATPLGFVSWQGRFMEASRGGTWMGNNDKQSGSGKKVMPGVGTGDSGGPFAVFEDPEDTVLIFSPIANTMTISTGSSPASDDGSFCFGLDAPVTNVPAGYTLETMVFVGIGVNNGMKAFGTALLSYYNTTRLEDYATKWLGFSTDNGAYYYYNTAPGKFAPGNEKENYQQTLIGVHEYAQKENIPYKHVLLDSWWYTKGAAGGVKEWDATNSTIPDGLATLAKTTGWKFQMHNRMWSDNNVYARQNGGNYDFVVEPLPGPDASTDKTDVMADSAAPGESGLAIPDDQDLWDDLIANKTNSGVPMVVYEQDWMYNEWQGLNSTRTSPTLSRRWLKQMGAGAEKQGVSVQYCMTFARMILTTAEIPAVTTFRASDDYGPGQTGYYPTQKPGKPPTDGSTGCTFPYCVYYVGTTSILAYALDLKPSKDNYWSTPLQPGSAFNHEKYPSTLNDTHEPYNEMQGAISSYTTAMVAPSDGIGYSNASLIKMSCRSDGFLLQPTAPMRAIDANFALSNSPVEKVSNVHAVMATHSLVGGFKWGHALVIGLAEDWMLAPSAIQGEIDTSFPTIIWTGYQPSDTVGKNVANVTVRAELFTASNPLKVTACNYSNFGLYHFAPILPKSGAAFLGELGKWVPIASGRVAAVVDAAGSLAVNLIGAANEKVELAFAGNDMKMSTVVCTIGSGGTATAKFDSKAGLATC